jgi:hypothetical protein
MKHIKYSKLLVLVFSFILLTGTTVPDEFLKMNNRLKERKYKIKVKVDLYEEGQTKGKIIESQEMSVSVWGNELHYLAGSTEAFGNEKYQIVIDHKQKIILINKSPKNKKSKKLGNLDQFLGFNFDSILSNVYKIKKIRSEGTIVTYRVDYVNKDSDILYSEYSIDSKTSILKNTGIQYAIPLPKILGSIRKDGTSKKKPYLDTQYETFEYISKYDKADFDFQKILQIDKKGKAIATKQYQTYKIINYLKVS